MKHLSFETLCNYSTGDLSPSEHEAVRLHMLICTHCQGEFEVARDLLAANANVTETMPPPPTLLRRAMAAYRRHRQQITQNQLFRGKATLQFDNWDLFALQGVRGNSQEHQRYYSLNDFDIDLQTAFEPQTNTFVLRGQILVKETLQDSATESNRANVEGMEVHLSTEGANERIRLTDELGQFVISHLAVGTYRLELKLGDGAVVIEPFVIQSVADV